MTEGQALQTLSSFHIAGFSGALQDLQFIPRLISTTTGTDYCLHVVLIFLRTNKAKLSQADYAV